MKMEWGEYEESGAKVGLERFYLSLQPLADLGSFLLK